MNIRRAALIALLSLGVVGGYGSGIYRMTHGHRDGGGCESWHKWHQQSEQNDQRTDDDDVKK